MRVASTASTAETASATPAPASSAPTWPPRPCRRRSPAAIASTSAASTPSRSVMIRASNTGSALPGADERARRGMAPGAERALPGLAHARRAEAECRLVQGVALALAVAANVHDVEVAQDPQLVRRGRERGAERIGQLAHAQLAERQRVHHLAARRI